MIVRFDSFNVVKDAIQLPDKVINSSKHIAPFVPIVIDDLNALKYDISGINSTLGTIITQVQNTKTNIQNVKPHLDYNNAVYTNIKNRHIIMVERTLDSFNPLNNLTFDSFDIIFANSSILIGSNIQNDLNYLEINATTKTQEIPTILNIFEYQINNINSTVNTSLNLMIPIIESFMHLGKKYQSNYSNDGTIAFQSFTLLLDSSFSILFLLIQIITITSLGCASFCMIRRKFIGCYRLINICACSCIPIYGFLGGILLMSWFFTLDLCNQTENYIVQNEKYYSPNPFVFNTILNNITKVNASDAILGVLKCKDHNILSASGFSFESFQVSDSMKINENILMNSIKNLNIETYLSNSTIIINNIEKNINISYNISQMAESLSNQINDSVSNYFLKYPLKLSLDEFQSYNTTLNSLNLILTTKSISPVENGSQILNLAPKYYLTTNPTPGKITLNGPGNLFDHVMNAGFSATQLNKIYGNLARDSFNIQFAPGPVEYGLIFLLSMMNAPHPIYAMETYQDYKLIAEEMNELFSSVNSTEQYSIPLLNIGSTFAFMVDDIGHNYITTISLIKSFVSTTIKHLYEKINLLPGMNCDHFGNLYRTYENVVCKQQIIALGGSAFSTIATIVGLFLMFILLMCGLGKKRRDESRGVYYRRDDSLNDLNNILLLNYNNDTYPSLQLQSHSQSNQNPLPRISSYGTLRENESSSFQNDIAKEKTNIKPPSYETLMKEVANESETGWKCPICLEGKDISLSATCGHVCCVDCWNSLLSIKTECPICKKKTQKEDLRRIFLQ